jgi:hypothetical protein
MPDQNDGQSWTKADLLKWVREHALEWNAWRSKRLADYYSASGAKTLAQGRASCDIENTSAPRRSVHAYPSDDDFANFTDVVAAPKQADDPNDTLAKWVERTPYPARRDLRKEIFHSLIRMFVSSYKQTVTPESSDLSRQEREDLTRGKNLKTDLKEKWAVERAAAHFECDDRTIREAVSPSARSVQPKTRTRPWLALNISRRTWYRRGRPAAPTKVDKR